MSIALDSIITVSTLLGNSYEAAIVYKSCIICIDQHELHANLIPLEMQELMYYWEWIFLLVTM